MVEPNHTCNVCGQIFSNTDQLDHHTKDAHGTQQDT